MIQRKVWMKNNIKYPSKIDTRIKIDCLFLLSFFNNLKFQKFLEKVYNVSFCTQRVYPCESYFPLIMYRNKVYLDFLSKHRWVERCLKQALVQFLGLKNFTLWQRLSMHFDNKLVVNAGYLKKLFTSPSTLLILPRVQTKIALVESSKFTGKFLWKYRDHIYEPNYEEVIFMPQQLAAFEFKIFNKYRYYDKLASWFLRPSPYIILDSSLSDIWMQSWEFWKVKKNANAFLFKCLFILIKYTPILPHVINALKLFDYNFISYFFDFHLMGLTASLSESELELFN